MKKIIFLLTLCSIIIQFGCRQTPIEPPYTLQKSLVGDSAMVVSAHPAASQVGMDILYKGGNAVDAAVAVQFALAVVYPGAGNLGGGGFMIYRSKDGAVKALDYREKAPSKASRNMYLDENGDAISELSRYGHLAVGVPGTVAGLIASHQEDGKLSFAEVINPAIELAEKGFLLTKKDANGLNNNRENFEKYNPKAALINTSSEWKMGDRLIQSNLAETLKRIRDNGKEGFYEGKTADLIVAEMIANNGLISHEDLKNYEAIWRTPVAIDYKDYRLYSMPPPSSGGICLAQLLGMVEPFPLSEWGFQATKTVHAMAEAERRAYADRAEHLGDADFHPVPLTTLIDKSYLQNRMVDFNPEIATSSDSILAGVIMQKESEETTHLSIIDLEGNAVSVTTTLNGSYGSKVIVSGAGFLLNNEMDDFSAKPGTPNMYGLIGAEANAVAPNKRMLSSMTPTIVERDSSLFMVVGTPGGSTIITSVYQVFLNVAEFGMTMTEAVNAPRFHHQWKPKELFVEKDALSETARKELIEMGHFIKERDAIGRVDAILVRSDGQLEGAGDKRGDDDARGF